MKVEYTLFPSSSGGAVHIWAIKHTLNFKEKKVYKNKFSDNMVILTER